MRMRVIVVRVGNSKSYPPTINLINALFDLGYEVVLCTTKDSCGVEKSLPDRVVIEYIDYEYQTASLNKRILNHNWLKKQLFNKIDRFYDENSIIWIEDDVTVKHLVYDIIKYNYILRFDELNECLYMTQHFRWNWLTLDSSRIGNSALAVVVPEYNRAHMMKVWWKLDELPFVLPNKPYESSSQSKPQNIGELPDYVEKYLDEIGDKKIILYQGKMHPERPVEPFIEAVQELENFAFVINAGSSNGIEKKYKNCYHVDFVAPPFHLQITQKAYIGVVAYIPGIGTDSVLNALYCAPNKIYEYGLFGIPFISNDLPPLKFLYDKYQCGAIADLRNIDDIRNKILQIDSNYKEYSLNARKMNDAVDFIGLVEKLITMASKRRKR